LAKLRALDHRRGVELASVKPQRERHHQPGEVQLAGHDGVGQPQPAGIDLVLELTAAPAQHGRLHDALAAVGHPVEHRTALSSSASSISPMPRLSRDRRGRVYPGIGVLSRWRT